MPLGAAKAAMFGAAGDVGIPYSSYWFGGHDGILYLDTITRVTFDSDTFSYLDATIGTGGRNVAVFSNNGTAGYAAGGGEEAGTASQTDQINKFIYATETCSVIGTTMGVAQESAYAQADVSRGNGYFGGGWDLDASSTLATVRVFVFASDTYTSDASSLSAASSGGGAYSNDGTAGYWSGSIGYPPTDKIDKTTFVSGTLATLAATLGEENSNVNGCSNSGTAGYLYGGYSLSYGVYNKLTYASDTNAEVALPSTAFWSYLSAGAANSGVAAYWYGGNSGTTHGKIASIFKQPFATDTTALVGYITQAPGGAPAGSTTGVRGCANCESL